MILLILLVTFVFGVYIPSFNDLPSEILLKNDLVLESELIIQGVKILELIQTLAIPPGTIVSFHGEEIPNGWALCNGTKGTPDLRDKFIVSTGSTFNYKETGGSMSETISISKNSGETTLLESQMPAHTHSRTTKTYMGASGWGGVCNQFLLEGDSALSDSCFPGAAHWRYSAQSGGGGAHYHNIDIDETVDTLPPYYALKYIMKLP